VDPSCGRASCTRTRLGLTPVVETACEGVLDPMSDKANVLQPGDEANGSIVNEWAVSAG